jgi:hypothetical protein
MVWLLMLCLLASPALAADKSLVLVEAPFLIVDQQGNASATIIVRNDTGADIPQLHLTLSDFRHRGPDGTSYPLGTASTLGGVNDGDKRIIERQAPLRAGATLGVRVTVTKLWEAGQSEAILKNGDTPIPTLSGLPESSIKAIRIPAAYNLQIISPTPDAPEIHFVDGRALVGLKNSDPFTYRLAWKLQLNGQLFEGREDNKDLIDLPAGATQYVSIVPDFPEPSWSSLLTSGTIKDEIIKGHLILEPMFEGDAIHQPLPSKDLPVTFRLSYFSEIGQQLMQVVSIFLLLAVGGVISLWVHVGMPNTTRALAVRRRIDDLETKIDGLGTSVASRQRVLLGSYPLALRRQLSSSLSVFPSFARTLDQLTKRVDMVEQWVELAYSASIILHQAHQNMHMIPPTVLRRLQEKCVDALTPIESGFTTDAEINAMKNGLSQAQTYLTVTLRRADDADLAREIIDREARLKDQLARLAQEYPQCAGMVNQVKDAIGNTTLSPADYYDRDVRSLKVELLWRFDRKKQQIGGDKSALERLETYCPELMKYLVADTHESLRIAHLIVDQMRQDIYQEALMAAVKPQPPGPPAITVTTDPPIVRARSCVRLALRFNRQILNEAAARQAWTCSWDFGDDTPHEEGWEVFHSYEDPGRPVVKISIRDLDGKPVISEQGEVIVRHFDGKPVISKPVQNKATIGETSERSASTYAEQPKPKAARWSLRRGLARLWRFLKPEPETRLEFIRLAIVLTLALLALMTTARQQVLNLSFLEAVGAVVALGFGADTIKNLIVNGSSSN